MTVQSIAIEFGALPWTIGNDRPSVIVNLKHQISGLQLGVAEQSSEDEDDIGTWC